MEERARREEEIRLLLEKLAMFGANAVERRKLEAQLREAQRALQLLDMSMEIEGEGGSSSRCGSAYSAMYASVGYDDNNDDNGDDEYVPPVTIKMNPSTKRSSDITVETSCESSQEHGEGEEGSSGEGIDDDDAVFRVSEITQDGCDNCCMVPPQDDNLPTKALPKQQQRKLSIEMLVDQRRLSVEMIEDEIQSYSSERLKKIESMNEDEFLAYLLEQQEKKKMMSSDTDRDDDEEEEELVPTSSSHSLHDHHSYASMVSSIERSNASQQCCGDEGNSISSWAERSASIPPSPSSGNNYQLQEQLQLAQEAIHAIELLDEERIHDKYTLDNLMEEHEQKHKQRMVALETYVAKLEYAMLQSDEGQRDLSMKLTDMLSDKIKALDVHVANLVGSDEEEKSLMYWKSKAERLEVKCFALEGDLEESDMTIQELKDTKKVLKERIAELVQELEEEKQKNRNVQQPPPPSPVAQEKVQVIKAEDSEIVALKAEIQALKNMQNMFPKYDNDDDEDGKLAALTREIMKLISDKTEALDKVEKMKVLYEQSFSSSTPSSSSDRRASSDNKPPSSPSKGRRRLSLCAAGDPKFSAQLRRASMSGDINEQMREEAKIEMKALEERLKDMDGEKAELLKELATMKAILAAADGEKPDKKTERLVYQLSCKKCNKHMNFVGTTHTDLKSTMQRHFERVVEVACKNPSKSSSSSGGKRKSNGSEEGEEVSDDKSQKSQRESWHEEFALHFAKHCKKGPFKSVSKKEVIDFCRQNVKVEVLKRSDGAELYWEDTF